MDDKANGTMTTGAGPNVVLVEAPIDISGPAIYVHRDAGFDQPWPECQGILYPPGPHPHTVIAGSGCHVRTTEPVNCPLCLTGAHISVRADDPERRFIITRDGVELLVVLPGAAGRLRSSSLSCGTTGRASGSRADRITVRNGRRSPIPQSLTGGTIDERERGVRGPRQAVTPSLVQDTEPSLCGSP